MYVQTLLSTENRFPTDELSPFWKGEKSKNVRGKKKIIIIKIARACVPVKYRVEPLRRRLLRAVGRTGDKFARRKRLRPWSAAGESVSISSRRAGVEGVRGASVVVVTKQISATVSHVNWRRPIRCREFLRIFFFYRSKNDENRRSIFFFFFTTPILCTE